VLGLDLKHFTPLYKNTKRRCSPAPNSHLPSCQNVQSSHFTGTLGSGGDGRVIYPLVLISPVEAPCWPYLHPHLAIQDGALVLLKQSTEGHWRFLMNSQISSPASISSLGILRAGSFNKTLGLFAVPLFVDFTIGSLAARPTESTLDSSSLVCELFRYRSPNMSECALLMFWLESSFKDRKVYLIYSSFSIQTSSRIWGTLSENPETSSAAKSSPLSFTPQAVIFGPRLLWQGRQGA